MGLLYLFRALVLPDLVAQASFVALMATVLYALCRPVLDLRVRNAVGTVLIGVLVFVLWIAPNLLWPGYRHHWLFENPILGYPQTGLSLSGHNEPGVLLFRSLRSALIVPIVEELFWRAWLMRWLIKLDFGEVPLGTWSAQAFWITAILFAMEHSSYWDVGLMAGILYNWWMIRTKSLGDLILAHGITNGLLCIYLIAYGKWEYWS
jgi:CAAX prenyl protease-like protein